MQVAQSMSINFASNGLIAAVLFFLSHTLASIETQGFFSGKTPRILLKNKFPESISADLAKPINILSEEQQHIIEFAVAKWSLSKKGREIVKNAALIISREGASQVLIVGHADQRGNPEYNLRLSRLRSEAVMKVLLQENISPNIIKVEWRGEFDPSVPVGENDLESKNRRVVIHVFH